MTRIPPAEMTGPYAAIVKRMCRKMLGEVPDALGVGWHQRKVLTAGFSIGRKAKKWNECDESLKAFAHMAVASQVGCSFCLDLGYYTAHHDGLDVTKAREVPRWRESEVLTPLERDVLAYAEAMTHTPPTVTDAHRAGDPRPGRAGGLRAARGLRRAVRRDRRGGRQVPGRGAPDRAPSP